MVSAERYAESEAYYKWHGFTPRTEEEEEQYNLFLQQEYHELGARDRERAASYAEAAQYQATKANEEVERRKQIALKAATKKNKKEAEARAAADRNAAARKEAERAQALRRQFLSEIEGPRQPLKQIKQSQLSRVSYQHARVLIEIRNQPKLTSKPSTTSSHNKNITEKKRPREAQRLAAQSFLSTSNIVEHKRGERSMSDVEIKKTGRCTKVKGAGKGESNG